MTRVEVKFRDGTRTNLDADGFYQEGAFLTVYKRNDPHTTALRGMVFETVGRFHEEYIAAMFMWEKTEK